MHIPTTLDCVFPCRTAPFPVSPKCNNFLFALRRSRSDFNIIEGSLTPSEPIDPVFGIFAFPSCRETVTIENETRPSRYEDALTPSDLRYWAIRSQFSIFFVYGRIRANSTSLDSISHSRLSILLSCLWRQFPKSTARLAQSPISRLHRRPPPKVPRILPVSVRNCVVGVEQRSSSPQS